MSDEGVTGLIVAGFSVTVVFLAELIAWAVSKSGRSSAQALWGGTFAPPMALTLFFFASFAADQDVDGPPPGMIIGGLLIFLLMLIPLCFTSSWICVWLLRKSSRS